MPRRKLLALAALPPLAPLAAALGVPTAHAQGFPQKPVTIVVPFAPGGTADVVARVMANEMSKTLGQPVLVETRPGAGGNVGAEYVAKQARPDGHTILIGSLSLATNVSLMKMTFDPRRDLVAVAGIANVPNLLVVGADSPLKTVADVIAAAKAKPGALLFGSSGPGTSSHLAGELFKDFAGIDMTHVPFKGSGAVYPDLMAGRISMLFDLAASASGQVAGGKVRAIATTARKRSPAMPNVPAIAETLPGYEIGSWLGFFAPPGTPKDALARLEEATAAALKTDSVRERLAAASAEPIPVPGVEFGKFFAADVERWARLVKAGKIDKIEP